ncbi:MAG: alanine--tRNA ligase, partial [Gemmatimonadaceae bacterium]|nr:alanine--tRNA ligase [Chitinophagaceae bacterium]
VDEEAMNEWKKVIAADRILLGNKKDNFWEMGDTGPCGPCTEIHVDCRPDKERAAQNGAGLVNNDHPQVIEIWNNVFIQYNRSKDGSLELLPARHVDTGMGFERLVRVLQGKSSNYDTDVFTGTIAETESITGKKYVAGDDKQSIAFRVIADHIRAIAFTIADGQLPSNTGAGYVIRRILRRAVRYYYSYLDHKQPMLYKLLPVLAKQFTDVFPELLSQSDFVTKVVKEEEDAFLRTLDKGIGIFENYLKGEGEEADKQYRSEKTISGRFAFKLNDTYGFPLDLTELMARENDWSVDKEGFKEEMLKQKDRSRAASSLDTEDWQVLSQNAPTGFVGYETLSAETKVLKYRKIKSKGEESYQLVLQSTPFYAESGGQVGDTGLLYFDGEEVEVTGTKKENELTVHFTKKIPVNITSVVRAIVDSACRKKIAVHHSATHLLHAALRTVLGTHVAQKGSLVNNEHLRFDFSHFAKVTAEEIRSIEILVNEKIRENIPVVITEMSKEEALKLGAMALFGEKYGDTVRVVVMDEKYSVELCGGTHVGATGELGYFKIKHEAAVAAGVRRIEALSGAAAEKYIDAHLAELSLINEQLKHPKEAGKAIESLLAENAAMKKKLENLENRMLVGVRNELMQKDEIINGVTFIGEIIEVGNPDSLKKLCTDLKNNIHDHLVVLVSNIGGKPYVAIGISETVATARQLDAGKIIKEHLASIIKGGGGGQKTLATAGGTDVSGLAEVIAKVKSLL